MPLKYELKISRQLWALIIIVANAANVYLVPQIHVPYLVEFTTVVINGLIGYFSFKEAQAPPQT